MKKRPAALTTGERNDIMTAEGTPLQDGQPSLLNLKKLTAWCQPSGQRAFMVSMYSANARHTRNRSTKYKRFFHTRFTPFLKGVANRLFRSCVLLPPCPDGPGGFYYRGNGEVCQITVKKTEGRKPFGLFVTLKLGCRRSGLDSLQTARAR